MAGLSQLPALSSGRSGPLDLTSPGHLTELHLAHHRQQPIAPMHPRLQRIMHSNSSAPHPPPRPAAGPHEPPRSSKPKAPGFATPDPQPRGPQGGEQWQQLTFAAPHVKALVGEVVRATDGGDDTHQKISGICRDHSWRFYVDVRGESLQPVINPVLLQYHCHSTA